MTRSRKAPAKKQARKQGDERRPKRAVRRKIQEPNAAAAAARRKTGGEASVMAAPARSSKKATILGLLRRPNGAAISDLTAATGWQGHSVRAALTGLRKEGKELVRAKNKGGVTHYWLAAAA